MAKNKIPVSGIVYSTDPSYNPFFQEDLPATTAAPAHQQLKVKLDKKHRGGKIVTIIEGYIGTMSDMEALGKELKTFCGTGGSVKDKEIIIQGDHREKVCLCLIKKGYKNVKKI